MDQEEQDAIRQVLAGDRDAFRVLMERHLPAVQRVSLRVTGNPHDAEEATQEAFLRAYNKLPEFRKDSGFATWIYRIAMNCAINLVERRSRELTWQGTAIVDAGDEPGRSALQIPDARLTPEDALLSAETSSLRQAAMAALTPMERSAFVLRHMEDASISEIAEALGVPVNSAKQAVFRAVAKLRLALAPQRAATPLTTATRSSR